MINAAIYGLGRWGSVLVDAVHGGGDKIKITTAIARTPEAHKDFAAARGLTLSGDYAAVLCDPAIDAVILATPPWLHAEQTVAAAKAGKHVFVEKPFALTREDAEAAAGACRAAGVVLAVGFNRRLTPAMTAMKAMISAGRIGTPVHIECQFSGPTGFRVPLDSWRATAKANPAGGMVPRGIHCLDAMIHLIGNVASVFADSDRRATEAEFDDATSMLLRFANGATGYLSTIMVTGEYWRCQVFGTAGWIETRSDQELVVSDLDGNSETETFQPLDTVKAELEAFADAAQGFAPFFVTSDEAVHGVAVLEAIVTSAASGANIDL